MKKLCGECGEWKRDRTLDKVERNSIYGIENIHFMGICGRCGQETDRIQECLFRKESEQQDKLRRMQREILGQNPRKAVERERRQKPADGMLLTDVINRFGLTRDVAAAWMELAGSYKELKGKRLWCYPGDLERIEAYAKDKPEEKILEEAMESRKARLKSRAPETQE